MGQEKWLVQIERWKKSVRQQISVIMQKIRKLIGNCSKRILVDNSLSEHLNHHEYNNIGIFKRGNCLFMTSNREMCMDLFVVMLKLEGGWVKANSNVLQFYKSVLKNGPSLRAMDSGSVFSAHSPNLQRFLLW